MISSVLAGLHDLLKHGEQVLDVADLLVRDENQRIAQGTASIRSASVTMYGEM